MTSITTKKKKEYFNVKNVKNPLSTQRKGIWTADYLDYSNILLTKWNARFKQEKDKVINLYEGKDIVKGGGTTQYQWVLGKRA